MMAPAQAHMGRRSGEMRGVRVQSRRELPVRLAHTRRQLLRADLSGLPRLPRFQQRQDRMGDGPKEREEKLMPKQDQLFHVPTVMTKFQQETKRRGGPFEVEAIRNRAARAQRRAAEALGATEKAALPEDVLRAIGWTSRPVGIPGGRSED